MIYLKIICAWWASVMERFKSGKLLDIRESSHRQRDLVKYAKIVKETKEVRISFKPFMIRIDRMREYGKFDKVGVDNKNVKILMEDREPYGKE